MSDRVLFVGEELAQLRRRAMLIMFCVIEACELKDEIDAGRQIERLRKAMMDLPGGRETFAGAGPHKPFRALVWDAARLMTGEWEFDRRARWSRVIREALGGLRGLGDVLD